jgi:hypothetical protein
VNRLSPEQEAELMCEFAANRARQKAITRRQRLEAGEFAIELEPAPGEPDGADVTFQESLHQFMAALREGGVRYKQLAIAFDSVDAHGYPLPEFLLAIKSLATPAVLSALAGATGMWVQAKLGRKVRLKVGEVEAEGRSVDEVEELLAVALKFQKEQDAKDPDGSGR